MTKKILALLLVIAMLASFAACGSEQTETNPPAGGETQAPATEAPAGETEAAVVRDTFTMAISYMPSSLSPASNGSDDYTTMTRPLYDKLFVENNDGGIDYYLAKNLDISDDGLTYTLTLRDDITWSDGTPITTKDIKFAMDYWIA